MCNAVCNRVGHTGARRGTRWHDLARLEGGRRWPLLLGSCRVNFAASRAWTRGTAVGRWRTGLPPTRATVARAAAIEPVAPVAQAVADAGVGPAVREASVGDHRSMPLEVAGLAARAVRTPGDDRELGEERCHSDAVTPA